MEINQRSLQYLFFFAVFVAVAALFVRLFLPFLTPIVLAAVLVAVFWPVFCWMHRRVGEKRRGLAALLTSLIVMLVVIVPLLSFAGLISKAAYDFYITVKDQLTFETAEKFFASDNVIVRELTRWGERLNIRIDLAAAKNQVATMGADAGLFLYHQGSALVSNIVVLVLNFVLMLFVMFYFFRDGRTIIRKMVEISPLPDKREYALLQKFREASSAVFVGNILTAVVQGVLVGIGLAIAGVPSALIWGTVVALLALLPMLGTSLVYVPAGIFVFMQGRPVAAIILVVYSILVQIVFDNYLKPKLIERKIQAHPLLVFFSILGGMQVFGMLGIVYGPLIVSVFLSLLHMYRTEYSKG